METVPAKTIVTRTKFSGWFGTEYNMNLYRGCSHGCIYCDSRSLCYHIEEFERVRKKEDALRIVRDDLRRKVKKGVVGTGAMSDPYNPHEGEECLTRNALSLLDAYGFGVAVATKSPLITRDADILAEIQSHSPVLVKMTITSAEDDLCRHIEPRVAPSSERFAAIRTLADAGIFTGILMMPVLPFLQDNEENILGIVRKAQESGARFIYPAIGMTLRAGNREYYYAALDRHFPGLRRRYQKQYGDRYQCTSPRAKALWGIFTAECDRLGLLYQMRDIISGYKMGYPQQLALELP